MALSVFSFVLGLGALYLGADWLIRGASRIAGKLRVNPMIIGLTVVAMGTSMPELLVSVVASVRDSGDIAIGNVVGSNITNIGLILGLAAVIRPIRVQVRLPIREVPIMIGAAILFYLLALNGDLSRWDGAALVLGFAAYILYHLRGSRQERPAIKADHGELTSPEGSLVSHVAFTIVGVGALLGGAHLVVNGAAEAARLLGVSDLAIGLTVVALGTSLPELATAVAALVHNEGDILAGSIVGSNVFNVLAVLGLASLARPLGVAPSVVFIMGPVMLALSVLLLPFVWTALQLSRLEGGILLASYGVFVIGLALA